MRLVYLCVNKKLLIVSYQMFFWFCDTKVDQPHRLGKPTIDISFLM